MKTDHHIAALLYDHDCVIITDFGGFVASFQPAQLNDLQHTFYPPSKRIAFNASLKNNDGLLANHISSSEKITYADACRIIIKYREECLQTLSSGKKLNIDKIGLLFYDGERNIQFIPDPYQNFLKDSFGLSLIHSSAVIAEEAILPVKDPEFSRIKTNTKFNWRIVELIPAAAMVVLMFTFPLITKNLDSQLSNLNPFSEKNKIEVASIPDKVAEKEKPDPVADFFKPAVKNEMAVTKVDTSENNLPVSVDTVPKLKQSIISTPPPMEKVVVPVSTELNETSSFQYYIITGCFRVEENATRLEADLKSQGFTAEILGKNDAGLTMVSISSYGDLSEAKDALETIKKTLNSGAWILRKKKGS